MTHEDENFYPSPDVRRSAQGPSSSSACGRPTARGEWRTPFTSISGEADQRKLSTSISSLPSSSTCE